MATKTNSPVSSTNGNTDSWKRPDDMSYFDWNNSIPGSVSSTPSTSISTPGAGSPQFSTWSKKLFSTPEAYHADFSPVSTAPTTPDISPISTPKEDNKIEKSGGNDYIPFLSTHSSVFSKWKQAKIEEEVDLSYSTTPAISRISETSLEKVFCCEECTTSITHDENFSPFFGTTCFPGSSIKELEVLKNRIDHSIEVLQVSSHQTEPYFLDPFASEVDIYKDRLIVTCNHYFIFSRTTRKYQAISFEFFAAVAVRFVTHINTTIYASLTCPKHNQAFFLTKHQFLPPFACEEKVISAPTGLGIIFDTCQDPSLPLVTAVALGRRAEEEAPSMSAYGLKTPELSPVQIAREKRGMMMSKQNYGQRENMEES